KKVPRAGQRVQPPSAPSRISGQKSASPSHRFLTCKSALIIVRVGGRTLVVDEVGGFACCGNYVESDGRMGEAETIGKVVGWIIGVVERGQVKSGLDEFEDAAEVVRGVRNVSGLGVR